MTLHMDPVEAFWILVNGMAVVLTFMARLDARSDLQVAKADTSIRHEARELASVGAVRDESLRLAVQVLLLSLVVPGLFVDRPVTLSVPVVTLILISVFLLLQTVLDRRDRSRLALLLVAVVQAERTTLALESSVQEVRSLVEKDIETTAAMFDVANHMNDKIATFTEALGHKEDKPPGDSEDDS